MSNPSGPDDSQEPVVNDAPEETAPETEVFSAAEPAGSGDAEAEPDGSSDRANDLLGVFFEIRASLLEEDLRVRLRHN